MASSKNRRRCGTLVHEMQATLPPEQHAAQPLFGQPCRSLGEMTRGADHVPDTLRLVDEYVGHSSQHARRGTDLAARTEWGLEGVAVLVGVALWGERRDNPLAVHFKQALVAEGPCSPRDSVSAEIP